MNPIDLLKNLGNIQEKLKESQEKIKTIQVTGVAGGDMVKITLSGDMNIVDVSISLDAVELDDVETLQDLIKAAHSDAMTRLKESLSTQMGSLGLNIPPGFMS